jgi:hypothetical protein
VVLWNWGYSRPSAEGSLPDQPAGGTHPHFERKTRKKGKHCLSVTVCFCVAGWGVAREGKGTAAREGKGC